jgi:hypothetical protein
VGGTKMPHAFGGVPDKNKERNETGRENKQYVKCQNELEIITGRIYF